MAYTADKLIKIALDEVGYLEKNSNSQLDNKTTNAGYNNWTKYARDLHNAGYYNGNKNGYAWCDCFHDWCHYIAAGKNAKEAQQVICQTGNLGAGCVYSAQYYRNAGRFHSAPQVGDQIFFGVKGDEYHTGIVYKVDALKVYTIEGNTSGEAGVVDNGGGVFKKSYLLNDSKIAGYGRPKYDETAQKAPVVSRNYLMIGDKGAEVKTMQEALIKLGYSCGTAGADGDFGDDTDKAVKAFQKANGLTVDGLYGEKSKKRANELLTKANAPTTSVFNKIDTVKEVQSWANKNYKSGLSVDGIYGANTKKALVKILQTELNQTYGSKLSVDGIFGDNTKNACPSLVVGFNNDVVAVLQALLICNQISGVYVDGIYGSATAAAVGAFQGKNGLTTDKIAGKNTFAKLCG